MDNTPNPLSFGEFARQIRALRKMGTFTQLLKSLPERIARLAEGLDQEQVEAELDHIELLAAVMTPEELRDPAFLPDAERTRELARRAEVPLQDTDLLFEQLDAARRFLNGEELDGDGPLPF